MSKAPAFQFYAQDFLTGCTYLTNEEIGMYIKMLCKQWTDGIIPKKRLGFLVGIEWDKFSEELKQKFTDFGDYILNERLEKEREKKLKFAEKQAENGRKGGRPKAKKDSESLNNKGTKPKPFKKQNPNKNQKKPLEDENEERSMNTEEEIRINENEKNLDFEKIFNDFNFTCQNLPQVKEFSETRKKAIQARVKEFGIDVLYEVFRLTNESDFLSGKITHFKASLDWILSPKNFIKILEGNYKNTDNHGKQAHNAPKSNAEHKQSAVDAVNALFGKQ